MEDLKHMVDGIFKKVQKLLEQKQALEQSIVKMQGEAAGLKTELKEKDKLITSLNEEIRTIKMTRQLVGNASGNEEFSDKITEMIKELDGVIGKLKTEKD